MMISIVLPVYNVENYLKECLMSIVNQKSENIQVIIIDDGSQDDSYLIAQKFCHDYPYIFEYYKKKNGGLSDARNYGIQYVKGDYIWFVDSDDYISDNAISIITECIQEKSPDLIITDYYELYSQSLREHSILPKKTGFISQREYLLSTPCAWNKIIKTELYLKHSIIFPKGIWYEDRATTGQYMDFCKDIYYIHTPLYYYRQRDNSIMNQQKYNPKMMDIIPSIIEMHKNVNEKKYKEEIEYITLSNLVYQSSIRLLPFYKYSEIRKCLDLCNELYPNWYQNSYYKNRSLIYRLFCWSIKKKYYLLSKIILFIYENVVIK